MKNSLKTIVAVFAMCLAACSQTGTGSSNTANTKPEAMQIAARLALADFRSNTNRTETTWAMCPGAPETQVLVVRADGFPERGRAMLQKNGSKFVATQGAAEDSYSSMLCYTLSKDEVAAMTAGATK